MTFGTWVLTDHNIAGEGEVKGKDTLYELTYSACTSGKGAEGMTVSHKKEKDLVIQVVFQEPTTTGKTGCNKSRVMTRGLERGVMVAEGKSMSLNLFVVVCLTILLSETTIESCVKELEGSIAR